MRTKILTLLFSFFSIGLFAQEGFNIGASGAGGLVFITYENGVQYPFAPKGGYLFGGNLGYNFSDHVGVVGEVDFSRQGQNYSGLTADINSMRYITLNYIQIPIMLKYMAGSPMSKFYIMVGPQWSILSTASITQTEKGVSTNLGGKEFFTPYDLGVAAELGSEFTLSGDLFMTTGLRFNYCLADINAKNYRTLYTSYNASYNAYAMLNIGVHYRFRNKE
jgi:hypothetical protein